MDALNNVVVQILRLCMPNTTIPVTNVNSRHVFHLPNMTMPASGTEKDDEEDEKDSDEGTY